MAKTFSILIGSTDKNSNTSSETLTAYAGQIQFDPPQVSVSFPPNVAVTSGSPSGAQWDSGSSLGFAYCKVTPTPAVGSVNRFYTQAYAEFASFPNSPDRRFIASHSGSATTLVSGLSAGTTFSLAIGAGGGTTESGLATSGDLTGHRFALILSDQDYSASTDPARQGGRTPVTDEILAAYNHNLTTNVLYTLNRISAAQNADGSAKTSWPAGSYLWPHPYHYVPMYENNTGSAVPKIPTILVIQEGEQYPLTGIFTVSGTAVSGQWGQLTTELSGTAFAIRVNGVDPWFLLSGVTNDNQMVIYEYGDDPQFTDAGVEATAYAIASGTVSVLPNLAGCANWDVEILPAYNDGDGVSDLTNVTYTASLVEVVAGSAPSGTTTYDWTVEVEGGATASYLNQGTTLAVNYTLQPKNVTVQVSGSGQPTCIHSDDTGFISLVSSVNGGTWDSNPQWEVYENTDGVSQTRNNMLWDLKGAATSGVYYHHHLYRHVPRLTALTSIWSTSTTTMLVTKGSLTTWPSKGSFIVHQPATGLGQSSKSLYCIYTGKQELTTADQLTGITVHHRLTLREDNSPSDVGAGAGTTTSCNPADGWIAYQQTQSHFPMAFVTGKVNNNTLRLDDAQRVTNLRSTTARRFWLCSSTTGATYRQRLDIASVNSTANEITFTQAISTGLGSAGDMLVLAPWDHWFTGGLVETSVNDKYWAVNQQSLLFVNSINGATSATVAVSGTFVMTALDPIYYASRNTDRQYQWTWLPSRGRLTFPRYTRENVVVEYDAYTSAIDGNGDSIVSFTNCKIVSALSHTALGTTHTFTRGGVAYVHKETNLDGASFLITKSYTAPDYVIENPSYSAGRPSYSRVWGDYIKASRSATSAVGGGIGASDQGSMYIPLAYTSIPAQTIIQVDSIYWPTNENAGSLPGIIEGPFRESPFP